LELLQFISYLTHFNGCHEIEAESDSIEVIQLCSGEDRICNKGRAIYVDIINQVDNIGKVEFIHCGRETNKVAHEIARDCFSWHTSCNWIHEPSRFLSKTFQDNVTVI
jgi:hypothetical protein